MDEDLENGESLAAEQPIDTSGQDGAIDEPKSSLEALERAVPIDGEVKPEEKIEPKAQEPKKAEVQEDLYKMPDGLQPKSQERFTKLVEMNQQKDAELAQVREATGWITQNFGQDENGFNDLAGFASYRSALMNGDYESAGNMLRAQIQQFTLLTGKPLQANPFEEFPDLQQRIDAFELDESDALEIARFRKQQAMLQNQQQQAHQNQQQQAAHKQEMQQVESYLAQMISNWQKSDIDFPMKEKIIAEKLKNLPRGITPSQIPDYVKMLYETVSAVNPQKPAPSQAPLRATGQGAGNAKPKSSLEAMDLALGYAQ